ncbi:MAG: UvrD-helicase domain-containing protein [Phycisphaerales bacterium]|nr:UvrD-helicase domain-containing protein [Phycisphaerales bacterium]
MTANNFNRFEIIEALAGSGKTYKLAMRYIRLLAMGASPDSILATTFSKKAAGEIRDRIIELIAKAVVDEKAKQELLKEVPELEHADIAQTLELLTSNLHQLRIGTIDSFFVRTAKVFQDMLGMRSDWTILDVPSEEILFREAVCELTNNHKELSRLALAFQWGLGGSRVPVVESLKVMYKSAYNSIRESGSTAWLWGTRVKLTGEHEAREGLARLPDIEPSAKGQLNSIPKTTMQFEAGQWKKLLKQGITSKVFDESYVFHRKPLTDEQIEATIPIVEFAKKHFRNELVTKNEGVYQVNSELNDAVSALKHTQGKYTFNDIAFYLSYCKVVENLIELQYRLDMQINHLLIDEFQDTSVTQYKVLEPLMHEIYQSDSDRSLFYVGDVKQSLYSFRGGEPGLLRNLKSQFPDCEKVQLKKSYRCSTPVLNAVNEFFLNARNIQNLSEISPEAIVQWQEDFKLHQSAFDTRRGYACIQTTGEDDAADDVELMIQKVKDVTVSIIKDAPDATIGILVRKNTNQQIQRIVHELRNNEAYPVLAAEHRGNPLTDSPAVTVLMSLILMADHPGNSIARFHVCTSPIGEFHSLSFSDEAGCRKFGKQLRLSLLKDGYEVVLKEFAGLLVDQATGRDRLRMWQLIEQASQIDSSMMMRPSAFVNHVMNTKIPDPASSKVQVMTIHASKGLSFDAVIMCDLQASISKPPKVLSTKDGPFEAPSIAGLYSGENSERVLEEYKVLRQSHKDEVVNSTLCTLYVGMTRAKHSLHIVVPTRSRVTFKTLDCVLLQGFGVSSSSQPNEVLWESDGSSQDWKQDIPVEEKTTIGLLPDALNIGSPSGEGAMKGRGVPTRSPSSLEGGGERNILARFDQSDSASFDQGTLIHHWFEQIKWLETPIQDDWLKEQTPHALLHRMGESRVNNAIKLFKDSLQSSEIQQLLTKSTEFVEVFQEYPFLVRLQKGTSLGLHSLEDTTDMSGTIDRLVIERDASGTPIRAEVIDWKSDIVDETTIDEKIRHYEPQLATYVHSVSLILGIELENIQAKLAFVRTGDVVALTFDHSTANA